MSLSEQLRLSADRCRITARKFPGALTEVAFETLARSYELEAERIERGGFGVPFGPGGP